MELSWTTLWDDDGDDDEDYDPLKDPLSKEKDDSDEEFDGLMELLSPSKKPKSSAGGGGDDSQTEQQNGDTSQEKGTPEVIGKRTRRRVHLPDEVWKDAESQLEQAERVLDPASPTDLCTDPNTQALSSQEYQRLLAVARGQAEPEDAEEDDDDEDFVPESDTEVDGGKGEEEGASQVNISRGELSDLIAENRDRAENASAKTDGAASKKRRVGRNRRSESDTAVRTISDGYAGSAGPGGFTKDQCIQLQGQMREYFQLASQQYVISCCDKDKIEERTDDIRILYEGLADLYRIWEVTTEYSKIQEKAMRILTEQIVGASENEQAAVHVRSEPRFSFFNLPGIELVPTVLQRVSDACSSDPAPAAAATAHDHAAGQPRLIDAEAARRDSGLEEEARGRALEKAQGVLSVLDPYFNQELKLSVVVPAGAAGQEQGSTFTQAEDNLLLTGLKRFGTDWNKIHLHVLPTKATAQLRTRYRRCVRRDCGENAIKEWKFAHAAGLSEGENVLLQKGVQYYGARFDLISEKIIVNRTEEELRRAYTKLQANSRGLSVHITPSIRAEGGRHKAGQPRGSMRGARKSQLNSLFLEGESSGSEGEQQSNQRKRGKGAAVRIEEEEEEERGGQSISVQALTSSTAFEQETLPDSDEEEEEVAGAGAAGAAGAGAAHAGGAQREGLGVVATPRAAHQDGQLASTPQSSQLLHRIYLPGSPHHPRGISATPGSHANASGLTMTGSSVLSDSDSLPVFEGSNDGIESRQIFRLLEEGVSEGSNDAWLLSHNPPPPPPQTQSAPGAAGPVLSTPAARRGDAADRSVQDSSAGKSAAPTPFLDASAKDKEAPAPAGEEEEGWSEEQDLMVLMAGKAAAQDPAPSAYEESWKRLNREGSGGLQGRCVRALARRYEVLVSKAINFSRATAGS
eukprot:CAMPEP_0177749972 /NCGR_PEP_ID=MMETSP0484_2-20121128/32775_1 /TAXON_ID=354590 /ORGANISM="Rhodomonas lens, Strain RHODO" /LENGTH=914 /DNA_ID=CAMNT_0019264999 /DNA_START=373 /DNA_END=3117 /DNA_ORIENTATION=+